MDVAGTLNARVASVPDARAVEVKNEFIAFLQS
jgi:hypothetical protein